MMQRRWQDIAGGYPRRSFAGLMALYEANYARLLKLIPHLHAVVQPEASQAHGSLDLHLEVLERTRYTTTVSLTYYFHHDGEPVAEPNARIRVYHDARQVEVLSCRDGQPPETGRGARRTGKSTLTRRWEANLFLEKWLSYCLRQGHHFQPAPVRSPQRDAIEVLS